MSRSLNTRGVHVFKKHPTKPGVHVLSEVHPILWLTSEGQGRVALQDGQFFARGGSPLEKVPAWVKDALEGIKPATLAEYGYRKAA